MIVFASKYLARLRNSYWSMSDSIDESEKSPCLSYAGLAVLVIGCCGRYRYGTHRVIQKNRRDILRPSVFS